ncbi:hypothetical protein RHSIM_Rhsim08G0156500 [Rhododendron simsii]|uniref:Uncharacterized protein n=1 Tax=Rhododendron simsii TaxID=118357 RepID=A0A834LDC2_RHOSS|nr:hypothetical protein RHSIM_Rhsim08G0156500 [Rhododendron simsii]
MELLFVGVLPVARKKDAPDLFLVVSPIYIWLAYVFEASQRAKVCVHRWEQKGINLAKSKLQIKNISVGEELGYLNEMAS